jgi:hypothetical protein
VRLIPDRGINLSLGPVFLRLSPIAVDGWWPHWHTRADDYLCDWIVEWRHLWVVWRRDA